MDALAIVFGIFPGYSTFNMHNGLHDIDVDLWYEAGPLGGPYTVYYANPGMRLDFQNVTITDITPPVWPGDSSPPHVVKWDPDDPEQPPIRLDCLMTDAQQKKLGITYEIYDVVNKQLVATGRNENVTVPGTDYWVWDGTTGDPYYFPVSRGLYSYKMTVDYPTATNSNSTRSPYLNIDRATDGLGNPIYEAEYAGYDDNETPEDDTDDKYMYYIKSYKLRDTCGEDASQGEIWLYDPTLTKVASWNIATLPCRAHNNATDGLDADDPGIQHELMVKVPINLMQYAGEYKFVAHVKDDHANDYKDHTAKWALERNEASTLGGFACQISDPDSLMALYGTRLRSALKTIVGPSRKYTGYYPFQPEGQPQLGGSGVLSADVRLPLSVRTLNRITTYDLQHGARPSSATKNAVWAYYGHGGYFDVATDPNYSFLAYYDGTPFGDGLINRQASWDQGARADPDWLDLNAWPPNGLSHVKVAFLMACNTGGADGNADHNPVQRQQSISYGFVQHGAKVAIGFRNELRANTLEARIFNARFWDCMTGMAYDAQAAFTDAKQCLRGVSPWWKWMCNPVLSGDGGLVNRCVNVILRRRSSPGSWPDPRPLS